MATIERGNTILKQAITLVKQDRSSINAEQCAFKAFRESVSRARTTTGNGGTRTGCLLEAFKETVMSTPDFETAYDEPVSESLDAEFAPSLANALQKNEPVTQQFKRNLLVATTAAIESRTRFIRALEAEHESIQTVQKTVLDIEDTLQDLPACSLQCLQFERFVEVWETCEEAVDRCDRRSEQRQRHIAERQTVDERANIEAHALNAYLYDDLETQFPALHALAKTRRQIERCRGEATGPASHTQDSNCDGGLEASSN
jgi:hypothetical protein